jgi:hypothetical protein
MWTWTNLRRIAPLLLIMAALAVAAVVAPASARKLSVASCSSPTLTGPTSAVVGQSYTVDGCGFAPGSVVPLEIAEADGCCIALNQVADDTGRFSYTGWVYAPGAYQVKAWVKRSTQWRLGASWSFTASLPAG